jgi:hypothetical protein
MTPRFGAVAIEVEEEEEEVVVCSQWCETG